jgi:hypothetical protein
VGFDLGEVGLGSAVERARRDPFLFASSFPRHGVTAAACRQEIDALLSRDDLGQPDKEALLAATPKGSTVRR